VADLVDIAIPSNAKAAAEALGLKVHHNVTSGARVRLITRDEAEIAVECLRDLGRLEMSLHRRAAKAA
jgi:ATP-dependent Clp protease adapter protein ClpS